MFAVFKRDNAQSNFSLVGFWDNVESDKWVINTMDKLNLSIEHTRIVKFNKQEFIEAMNYQASSIQENCIGYDDVNDRIQLKKVTFKNTTINKDIDYDSPEASNYYPQSEIDEQIAAQNFWNEYNAFLQRDLDQNPLQEGERDWNANPPTQQEQDTYVTIPPRNFQVPFKEYFEQIIQEYQGTEMDINQMILDEQVGE